MTKIGTARDKENRLSGDESLLWSHRSQLPVFSGNIKVADFLGWICGARTFIADESGKRSHCPRFMAGAFYWMAVRLKGQGETVKASLTVLTAPITPNVPTACIIVLPSRCFSVSVISYNHFFHQDQIHIFTNYIHLFNATRKLSLI